MNVNLMTDKVLFDIKDGAAYITLNQPEKLNPVPAEVMQDLIQCLNECEGSDAVRVVILRGAGGNFTAGGDVRGMKERMDKGINNTKAAIRVGGELITRLRMISKPTIAWIEGAVAGVGMSMAMACDFSIAEETAKMVFAFVNIGFVPDGGITYTLSKTVGPVRATELLMSGKRFSGAEAKEWGIITDAVPKEHLEETVQKYIYKYSHGPSTAYAQIKTLINSVNYDQWNACMQREVQAQYACSLSLDHREAVEAFLEKRKPIFQGK